jgi:hypothetical protein
MRMLLLGDIGQQLDISESQARLDALRRSMRGKRHKDAAQDQQLKELRRDVDQLKLALAAVSRCCMAKGVFTQDELGRLLDAAEGEGAA